MRRRETFLDKLRAAATSAVVLLHTVTGVMDHTDMGAYPMEKTLFLIILDLICWCVPVFLLISGYLFLDPGRELTMGKMLTKYCRRIVLALLVFGVPYACLEQIAAERCFSWQMAGKAFGMVLRGESWSHLWYLYLILALYLLTPAIRKLLAVLPRPAVYFLLAVLFLGSSVLPYVSRLTEQEGIWMLPDWGIYVFYYICGFLFIHRRCADLSGVVMTGSNFCRDNTAVVCTVLAAVLALGMAGSRLSGNYTVQMAYNYPFTVVLSLLLFAGARGRFCCASREGAGRDAAWSRAAAMSFTVYLVHPVFLNIAYKVFHVTPLSFPVGIALPLFYLSVLLLSCAAALVLRRIPPLRDYVL